MAASELADEARRGKYRRTSLVILLLTGAHTCIAQTVLLREFLASLGGVEWLLGVALAVWLAGVFAGAAWAGRNRKKPGKSQAGLCLTASLLGVSPLAGLCLMRLGRGILGPDPGELAGLDYAFVYALAGNLPVGFFTGAVFPAAACYAETHASARGQSQPAPAAGARPRRSVRLVSVLYVMEGLGSFAGGLAWTYWLVGYCPELVVLGVTGALLVGVGLSTWPRAARLRLHGVATVLLLLLAAHFGPVGNAATRAQRWKALTPLPLVVNAQSRYQDIALAGWQDSLTLYTNGMPLSTFPDPVASLEEAVVFLTAHPRPRNALVLGSPLSGLAARMLDSKLQRLDAVELDPALIALLEAHLPKEDASALADPRLHLYRCDARRFVHLRTEDPRALQQHLYRPRPYALPEAYDLIVVDFGSPTSLLNNRVYTADFFRSLKAVLSPHGAVVCRTMELAEYWEGGRWRYARCMYATLRSVFKHVGASSDRGYFLLASDSPSGVCTDAGVLARRYERMGGSGRGRLVEWYFPAERTRALLDKLAGAATVRINTDQYPRACHLCQKDYWARSRSLIQRLYRGFGVEGVGARGYGLPGLIEGLPAWSSVFPAALALAAGIYLRIKKRSARLRRLCCLWAVGTTGFAAMACQILIIFLYQSLFGYVYLRVGLLTALFMLGLTLAAALGGRFTPEIKPGRNDHLLATELLLVVLISLVPWVSSAFAGVEAVPMLLLLAVGGITGLEYVWLAALYGAGGVQAREMAGRLNAADHLGALLGAVFAAVAVPVWGVPGMCLAAGILKGGSLLMLLFRYDPSAQSVPATPPA